MTTVAGIFDSQGLIKWWTISPSQTFGGASNGEWGTDYPMPINTPVGSVTDGRVVYAGPDPNNPGSSVGQVVQIEAPDGSLVHYQHLRTANVKQGDMVQAGSILGLSGGCPSGGYGANGCTFVDGSSTGPHIEVRYSPSYQAQAGMWYQSWQDSGGILQLLGNQTVDTAGRASFSTLTYSVGASPSGTTEASRSGGCTHKLQLPAGISVCLDGAEDFAIRGFIVLLGCMVLLMAFAVFAFGNPDVQTGLGKAQGNLKKLAPLLAA